MDWNGPLSEPFHALTGLVGRGRPLILLRALCGLLLLLLLLALPFGLLRGAGLGFL